MNNKKTVAIGIVTIFLLNTTTLVHSDHKDSNFEDFEKTKKEILAGRKFNDLSTPANALLTFISALHHQDQNTLLQVFPYARQAGGMPSPMACSELLDLFRDSVVCKIQKANKSAEESDLCGIHTTASPGKETDDQVWLFAYLGGAWRLLRSTPDKDATEWRTIVEETEAATRKSLQFEAKSIGASTRKISQEEAEKIEGKWNVILPESNQRFVMRFWSKPDGTLTGAATVYNPDDRPFAEVTFENGKLCLKENKNLAIFEGTMTADGLTIEGKLQKPDEAFAVELKRVEQVRSKTEAQVDTEIAHVPEKQARIKPGEQNDGEIAQASQEPFPDHASGTSHKATTATLLLLISGIIAVTALFIVKYVRG